MKSVFWEYPDLFHAELKKYDVSDFVTVNHVHDKYELSLCASGNITVDSNDFHTEITAPCLLLHRPYTVHHVDTDRIHPYIRQNIYFDIEFLNGVDRSVADPIRVFTSGFRGIPLTERELERLDRMIGPLHDDENACLRLPLLIAILREIERINPEETLSGDGKHYIGDVIRFINDNYADPIDSDTIAKRFFISRTKLDRDFGIYTQTSVRKFITSVRLKNALRFMRSGVNVGDSAARSGFNDVSHFIRTFRQCYGLSPHRYVTEYGNSVIYRQVVEPGHYNPEK